MRRSQKGPVAACVLDLLEVDIAHQNVCPVMGGLGDHAAERVGEKGTAPELQSGSWCAVSSDLPIFLGAIPLSCSPNRFIAAASWPFWCRPWYSRTLHRM